MCIWHTLRQTFQLIKISIIHIHLRTDSTDHRKDFLWLRDDRISSWAVTSRRALAAGPGRYHSLRHSRSLKSLFLVAGLCRGASTGFMVASDGVLSEGYGHDGSGVCLGDGQTEAEELSSQDGCGDGLLRPMLP